MKRDMGLIRELMLRLEAHPMPAGAFRHFEAHDEELAVPGYDAKVIAHHLTMIAGSGFIDTGDSDPSYGIGFKGLTWAGGDFVDSVRHPEIWRETQKGLEKVKGFTVELVLAIAKGIAKKKASEFLGFDIG